jgi:hypothetical protein
MIDVQLWNGSLGGHSRTHVFVDGVMDTTQDEAGVVGFSRKRHFVRLYGWKVNREMAMNSKGQRRQLLEIAR